MSANITYMLRASVHVKAQRREHKVGNNSLGESGEASQLPLNKVKGGKAVLVGEWGGHSLQSR